MATLTNADLGDDTEVVCSECEAVFTVIFRRSAVVDRVEFCPFCGDEIDVDVDTLEIVDGGE